MFDEPRSREVLGQLPVRSAHDPAVLGEGKGAHPRGAGIDGDHDGHGGTVAALA